MRLAQGLAVACTIAVLAGCEPTAATLEAQQDQVMPAPDSRERAQSKLYVPHLVEGVNGEQARQQVLADLASDDEEVRWQAIVATGAYGREEFYHDLLSSSNPKVVAGAVLAARLGRLQVDALGAWEVLSDPDASERDLLEALAVFPSSGLFVDKIKRHLVSPSVKVRLAAIQALRNCGSEMVIPELIKATEDSSKEVRIAAITALANISDPRILPALKALANDPEVGSIASEAASAATGSEDLLRLPKKRPHFVAVHVGEFDLSYGPSLIDPVTSAIALFDVDCDTAHLYVTLTRDLKEGYVLSNLSRVTEGDVEGLRTEHGVGLGSTREDCQRKLGKPTESKQEGARTIDSYIFRWWRGKDHYEYRGHYEFEKGQLVKLRLSRDHLNGPC